MARHIHKIKDLPISQLSDEEIVKAAMHRLKTQSILLVYDDVESNKWIFLGRHKKGGEVMQNRLRKTWEEKFGKFKKVE